MTKRITVTLNKETRSLAVEPSDILLDVLREALGVKSRRLVANVATVAHARFF